MGGGVRAAPNIVITAAMADKLGAVSGENFADLTSVSPSSGNVASQAGGCVGDQLDRNIEIALTAISIFRLKQI